MNFFAQIIADLLAMLLAKLGGDITSYIEQVKQVNADRAERLRAALVSVKPLKEAPNDDGKKIDDAASDALDGT